VVAASQLQGLFSRHAGARVAVSRMV